MKIPTDTAEKRQVMEEYVATVEAGSDKRAFRPENFQWESDDYKEWLLATVQGVGCEFKVWQTADNTVLVTVRADGPWPAASIDWVWRSVNGYLPALAMIIHSTAIDSGASDTDLDTLAYTLAHGI